MKEKYIYAAINEILIEYKIKAKWDRQPFNLPIDGVLEVGYKNNTERFYVAIKKELREFQLNQIFNLAEENPPFLVIAENLFPKIKDELIEQGIAYIEMNGNINIETENILLRVEGKQKKLLQPEKFGRAFTKTGLKTIFLYLTNANEINDTYREIARNAGIAIGNVKLIHEGLIENGYALKLNDKELKLTKKKELLEKWITAYIEKLKPTLYLGNFRFNNPDDFFKWKDLNLEKTQTQWGGEGAGNIYTDYLHPEILTIYTNKNKTDIIKEYRLLPDPNGNVIVYEKFWKDHQENINIVPPVIAYADLIATGNRRCIETAQIIYEQHIENTLQ